MSNYARNIPRDSGGAPMQEYPAPYPAVTRGVRDTAVVSSITILNQATSAIEVAATGGQGVVIRWIPIAESPTVSPFGSVVSSGVAANYDHVIPAGTVRRFVVPKETGGAVAGAVGSVNGLYQRVANTTIGTPASSILISEF